jgi:hypothetical protein
MFSNSTMRQSMGFFTAILTVGTVVIMTHICMRIIQAEQAVFGEEDLHKVHHVSPCPDAYVLDEESNTCKPNADVPMTIGGETIPGYDDVVYKFNGSADLPKVDDGEKMNMEVFGTCVIQIGWTCRTRSSGLFVGLNDLRIV